MSSPASRPPQPGDYGVVLVCQCSARHAPIYAVRWVSRPDAERIAAELALNNGHNFLIVRSNGLELPPWSGDYYRPQTTAKTDANRTTDEVADALRQLRDLLKK